MLLVKVVLLGLEMLVYCVCLSVGQDFFLAGGATVSWIASTACCTTDRLIGDVGHYGGVSKLLVLVISILHSVATC
jgi:hypothetical protein